MRIIFTNSKGLSFDFCNAYGLTLYNVEGLQPTELNASTIRKAYTNGVVVNNTHRGERQIILNLALTAGRENDRIRRNLYDILGDKEAGKFRIVDDDLDVYTEAFAEAPGVDTWTLTPTIQVSFLCPSSYFKSTQETKLELFQVDPQLKFPLELKEEGITMGIESPVLDLYELTNSGQASTGVRIEVRFTKSVSGLIIENKSNGNVLNIASSFRGENVATKEIVSFSSFRAGDILTITTEIGEKGAILYRDGAYYDIFSAVDYGEQWLRIERGKNIIRYAGGDNVSNDGMFITIRFNALYWGI